MVAVNHFEVNNHAQLFLEGHLDVDVHLSLDLLIIWQRVLLLHDCRLQVLEDVDSLVLLEQAFDFICFVFLVLLIDLNILKDATFCLAFDLHEHLLLFCFLICLLFEVLFKCIRVNE